MQPLRLRTPTFVSLYLLIAFYMNQKQHTSDQNENQKKEPKVAGVMRFGRGFAYPSQVIFALPGGFK
jgi:hypothetical protein